MIFTGIFCVLFLTTSTFLYLSVKRNLEFLEQQENLLELFDSSLQELEACHKHAIVVCSGLEWQAKGANQCRLQE